MSTMNSDQERTETEASGCGNNNYFYNSKMREHMFDKVLTPTDVGQLKRLLIPKVYALNFFPLDHNQKGPVLLDFQDRNGKTWRFRYLYWSSSQSYVFTKGWIRFVQEKKLCAGDTVSFHSGYIPDHNTPEIRRKIMFIDWRHEINLVHNINLVPLDHHHQWNLDRSEPSVNDSVPVFPGATPLAPPHPSTTRKMRLFGVDVEESSSLGETRGEMGRAGHSWSSPIVIRDDDQSSWRSAYGEMGASSSSVMQLSDDEEYKKKGKSLAF